MRGLFYNIRRFGQQRRLTQLKDYMKKNRLDFLGLQETIKAEFSTAELRSLACGGQFVWNWLPVNGHSGGLLLGFNEDCFEVGSWRLGTFLICIELYHRRTKSKWCFVSVYGPADHSRSDDFLGELVQFVSNAPFPVIVGGDFNLIRSARDKNNSNIYWPRVRKFNDAIAEMALREIERAGALLRG